MLEIVGAPSLDALVDEAIPSTIRLTRPLNLPDGLSEHQYLSELHRLASRNRVFKSYIGLGYYDCITPSVIVRNVLENPGVVHAVYAVSGRDRAGTARGAAQFPDDGQRADGNGNRERVAARRADRRRRSDGIAVPRPGEANGAGGWRSQVLRRRLLLPADHRRASRAGRAAGHRAGRRSAQPRQRSTPGRLPRSCRRPTKPGAFTISAISCRMRRRTACSSRSAQTC